VEDMDRDRKSASPLISGRQIIGKSVATELQFRFRRRSFLLGVGIGLVGALVSSAHAESCKQLKKELEELVAKRKKLSNDIAKKERDSPGKLPFEELDKYEKKKNKYNQRIILIGTKSKKCT
jgi:hypothetical protein